MKVAQKIFILSFEAFSSKILLRLLRPEVHQDFFQTDKKSGMEDDELFREGELVKNKIKSPDPLCKHTVGGSNRRLQLMKGGEQNLFHVFQA